MTKRIKWSEKYELGLKEPLSIKDIMQLRDHGKSIVTIIKTKVINYFKHNNSKPN